MPDQQDFVRWWMHLGFVNGARIFLASLGQMQDTKEQACAALQITHLSPVSA